jgi:hypothetical protein
MITFKSVSHALPRFGALAAQGQTPDPLAEARQTLVQKIVDGLSESQKDQLARFPKETDTTAYRKTSPMKAMTGPSRRVLVRTPEGRLRMYHSQGFLNTLMSVLTPIQQSASARNKPPR